MIWIRNAKSTNRVVYEMLCGDLHRRLCVAQPLTGCREIGKYNKERRVSFTSAKILTQLPSVFKVLGTERTQQGARLNPTGLQVYLYMATRVKFQRNSANFQMKLLELAVLGDIETLLLGQEKKYVCFRFILKFQGR